MYLSLKQVLLYVLLPWYENHHQLRFFYFSILIFISTNTFNHFLFKLSSAISIILPNKRKIWTETIRILPVMMLWTGSTYLTIEEIIRFDFVEQWSLIIQRFIHAKKSWFELILSCVRNRVIKTFFLLSTIIRYNKIPTALLVVKNIYWKLRRFGLIWQTKIVSICGSLVLMGCVYDKCLI